MNHVPITALRFSFAADLVTCLHAGSLKCFKVAQEYFRGFWPMQTALVVGNHDLEGEDFETDEENLAAWSKVGRYISTWLNGTALRRQGWHVYLSCH